MKGGLRLVLLVVSVIFGIVLISCLSILWRESILQSEQAYVDVAYITVNSQITSKIDSINVKAYKNVKKGELLLRLDSQPYVNQLKQLQLEKTQISLGLEQLKKATALEQSILSSIHKKKKICSDKYG